MDKHTKDDIAKNEVYKRICLKYPHNPMPFEQADLITEEIEEALQK